MANKLALGLVIGGAVSASVGAAFRDVEGRIGKLKNQGDKVQALRGLVGETIRLRDEWKRAHDSGAAGATMLLGRLEKNLEVLRKQGVEVGRLGREYRALGKAAQGIELQAKGHAQIASGRETVGSASRQAIAGAAATAVPTTISADYQAIIRDIAIKAGVARSDQEAQLGRQIVDTSRASGLARNDVADVVNQLVGAGMDLKQALSYAPVAAKFVIGQGAAGTDTAKMINALGQNARIQDPAVMQRALESIAYQGQAGSFEASDMAKWFPELLAGMDKLGISGMDAVTQLGSMLQVQVKTAGGADEAANNLKNWMEKIGSGDVVKAYKDAGIDYQGSMNTGLQKGMSTLEASFALAQRYIEKTDPSKAQAMAEATAKISQEADPAKAKAMMQSLEQALRTGDIFADMQVKAALTAYMQNKQLYEQLKREGANAAGILDKNLDERRDASGQKWRETSQAFNDALRSVGDAIRPATDLLAEGLGKTAQAIGSVADKAPGLTMGILGLGAAVVVARNAVGAFRIARGLMNVARGSMTGNPNAIQRVFVTNAASLGGPEVGGIGEAAGKGAKAGRTGWVGKLGRFAKLAKGAGPLAVLGAGLQAADTYANASTPDEKAEGYGGAAGGLAGTLAGGAAGAAIGSVVPVIGTAIGAVVGSLIGGLGGSEAGGWLSKKLFGGSAPEAKPAPMAVGATAAPPSMPSLPALAKLPEMPALPSPPAPPQLKFDQAVQISMPVQLTVEGDVKDPAQLIQQLEPFLNQRMRDMAEQFKQQTTANLYDAPHL